MEEDYSSKNGGRGSHDTYVDVGEDDACGNDGGGDEASGKARLVWTRTLEKMMQA